MGLLDRFRRGSKKEGTLGYTPLTSESPPSPRVASIVVNAGQVFSKRKRGKNTGVRTREVTQEDAVKVYEKEPYEYQVESTVTTDAEGVSTSTVTHPTIETPVEDASPLQRVVRASDNRRNWSPNGVGERAFSDYKEARAWARGMRQQGYTAKLVKLRDGTYKVYLYHKRGGRQKDPMSAFNMSLRGLKSTRGFSSMSRKKVMGGKVYTKPVRFTMPDFDIALSSRKLNLDFGGVSLGGGVDSMERMFDEINLSLGGGWFGNQKKKK